MTTATAANVTPISNSAKRFNDFLKAARKFGEKEGAGSSALVDMALEATAAAHEGIIWVPDPKQPIDGEKNAENEDHAAQAYKAYAEGNRSKNTHKQAGIKVHTSELRACVKLGSLAMSGNIGDPTKLLEETLAAREALLGQDQKTLSAWKCIVAVARKQVSESPTARLTKGEIEECCLKPETAEKDLVQKLGELYRGAGKRISETTNTEVQAFLEDAMENLKQALVEAGGDPADYDDTKKTKDKAAAQVAAFMSKTKLDPAMLRAAMQQAGAL